MGSDLRCLPHHYPYPALRFHRRSVCFYGAKSAGRYIYIEFTGHLVLKQRNEGGEQPPTMQPVNYGVRELNPISAPPQVSYPARALLKQPTIERTDLPYNTAYRWIL